MNMRAAIVSKKGAAYWYETLIRAEEMPFVTKILVSGDPREEVNLKRIIVKSGNEPATEVSSLAKGQERGAQTAGASLCRGFVVGLIGILT